MKLFELLKRQIVPLFVIIDLATSETLCLTRNGRAAQEDLVTAGTQQCAKQDC